MRQKYLVKYTQMYDGQETMCHIVTDMGDKSLIDYLLDPDTDDEIVETSGWFSIDGCSPSAYKIKSRVPITAEDEAVLMRLGLM